MESKQGPTATEKKRKRKEVAIYGNYRNYYGYRISEGTEEDPRLKVMKKEWFEGKDCLDIGCNSGLITINIAQKFSCQSILGVDIDGARIEDSNWRLRNIMRKSNHKVVLKKQVDSLENQVTDSQGDPHKEEKDLFKIVSFQKGDFVQGWNPHENKTYHAILCLSVAKWIHLNCGDDGLITLFSKVWNLLKPGGVFIFEPQPWVSYYKNRLVSEIASKNYQNIKIRPEDFQDILLDKIGFRTIENLSSSLRGSQVGFDRPILALWK